MKHVHALTSALLLVTILFAAAFTAFTQTADEHAKHHPVKTSPDASAVMTNMANSKDSNSAMSVSYTHLMSLSNGTKVKTDGTMKTKAGKTMMMKEGDMIYMNGKMRKMKMDEPMKKM